MSKDANSAARQVTLPENLEAMAQLSEEDREAMVKAYREKEHARLEARIAKKVERFSEKLNAKQSTDREIIVRRVLIQKLQDEINDRKASIKALRAEIKEMRAEARAKRQGREVVRDEKGEVKWADEVKAPKAKKSSKTSAKK